MAGQRRRESRGYRGRGSARGARLALALTVAALVTAACPSGAGVAGPGRGAGAGGGPSPSIVGAWRNVTAFTTTNGETVVTDTRWTFAAGGACSQTVSQTLVVAGSETTVARACSYTLVGSTLSVVFEGSSFVTSFAVAFAGGDLLLDGFRFTRIA